MFIRHPLRLRFIGEDGGEGAGGGEQAQGDQGQQAAPEQGQQSHGGNPAWESVRSQLDPISFSKIEPHLKDWDRQVQQRIEREKSQFAPYQQVIGQTEPQRVQQALAYSEMLDKNPEQVYAALGQFLQQNGRMPANAAEAQQAVEDAEEEDPQQFQDPRVDQLQQQLAQIAQAEAVREANTDLSNSIDGLRSRHADLEPADLKEIVSRAAFVAQQSPGQAIDFNQALESAYSEFSELKNRILSTPRQRDSAPQLPPLSGGTPTAQGQQQQSWGKVARGDLQDFIAAQLAQQKG